MKKIKLPLEMDGGVQVRTLDELKENWNLENVLNYYLNGKLQTWLMDRYYTELADKVAALNGIDDSAELQQKLCGIFGVAMEENIVDVEAVAERNRRLEILRQYTADDAVLKNVDKVAFNQEELADLLDGDESVIYLCDNKFNIPLSLKGKKYIGLGDVEIQINSKEYVDFAKLEIELVNVHFNKEYDELVNSHVTLYKKGEELETAEKYVEALAMYKKAGEMGNAEGLFRVGKFYHEGRSGVEVNYELARKFYEQAMQLGSSNAINNLANLYVNARGVAVNIAEALDLYKQAADMGNSVAMYNLGNVYGLWTSEVRDFDKSMEWYKKAADLGNADAFAKIGEAFLYGKGFAVNANEAIKYFQKAISLGSNIGYMDLGDVYNNGRGVITDKNKAINYYKEAAKLGNSNVAYELGYIYELQHNFSEAIRWYEISEKFYNRESENTSRTGYAVSNLAYIYERGYGVPVDIIKASKLYKRSYFKYQNLDAKVRAGMMACSASEDDRQKIFNICGIINDWKYDYMPSSNVKNI